MIQKIILKRQQKKEADKRFRQSLIEAMELDDVQLEEELKDLPPHQFSEEFERNMDELLKIMRSKRGRKRKLKQLRQNFEKRSE